jgi:hypothetical protein
MIQTTTQQPTLPTGFGVTQGGLNYRYVRSGGKFAVLAFASCAMLNFSPRSFYFGFQLAKTGASYVYIRMCVLYVALQCAHAEAHPHPPTVPCHLPRVNVDIDIASVLFVV